MAAAEELFQTYHEDGRPAGLVPRSVVHQRGLWHRAVHVLVFDGAARLLLQQRAQAKDIGAGLWDLSVGEHLQPGESWAAAAHRGLHEELAIRAEQLEPLGTEQRVKLDDAGRGIHDWEIQRTFVARSNATPQPHPAEVAAVRWLSAAALGAELSRAPDRFTPWFRHTIVSLDLLRPGAWPSAAGPVPGRRG